MVSNINYSEISTYSQSFSQAVCNNFFDAKTTISGGEILELTPLKQVNLFAIYELLSLWRSESRKLESPFFDYSVEEVKDALKKLMNVLSKNIKVERQDFEPLLTSATEKALLLIFSPYQFYRNEIDNPAHSSVHFSRLEELKKYVKFNKHLLEHYISRLQSEHIEEIFNEDAVRLFDEVCENIQESPDDFEEIVPQFSAIYPLDISRFYPESEENPLAEEPEEETKEQAENAGEQEQPVYNNLNETWHKDIETLADVHARRQIEGIKRSITINQRFMFVNELFEGNADEFEAAVTFLDNCEAKTEAMDYIRHNCIEEKGWDESAEEVQEFIQIVSKRFPEL